METNKELLALLNTTMRQLQIVQSTIDTQGLDKAFWIELGMIYRTYQHLQDLGIIPRGDKKNAEQGTNL
jgi:hypothetical protein